MYYSQDIVNEVVRQNDIKDVISKYTELREFHGIWFGRCPFENDQTYNLIVDTHQQTFQCMSCGKGGNVIEFIMDLNHCDFISALEMLATAAKIFLPTANRIEPENIQRKRQLISRINRDAQKFYASNLTKDKNAGSAYFNKRRLSQDTIRKFGLGVANEYGKSLYNHLINRGYLNEDLLESGLIGYGVNYKTNKYEYYDKFWDRVMFPIIDVNSKVIGFGGRVLNDAKPKYMNSPETAVFDKGRNLFGYNFAQHTQRDSLILCEGFMDVISLHQAEFDNSVASLGTALTANQVKIIAKKTKTVFLSYDGDAAGVKAALRAIPLLKNAGITARILRFGDYKDPDELISKKGPSAFEAAMQNAETDEHFMCRVIKAQSKEKDEAYYSNACELLMKYL
jgi:DNA primase